MGVKRKVAPKSSSEPQPKHHHPESKLEEEEEYEEVEEEEEEYEEVEEEEEDDNEGQQQEGDEDDDPIPKLLEPFGKDQLLALLCDAAAKHRDVADQIRRVADEDASHRKIFVHGLGWDTTAETLVGAFSQYGEIEDCKAVMDKVTGKSKGYGFVLFKTRRGARNALKEPQKKIGNRMTACQLASTGPVPQNQQQSQQQNPAAAAASSSATVSEYTLRKIYVSNVGSELDPKKLLAFFARFGEIEEGPLGLDKATGKPKGFCLFVYKSAESAKRALAEPHKEFEGHTLHCQKAIDGPKHSKMQNAPKTLFQRNDNAGFGGGGVYGGGVPLPGHLMVPQVPINSVPTQQIDPALGQALTALLTSQGASLGLTNLLGGLGSTAGAVNSGTPALGHGVQGGYSAQQNVTPGVIGGYGLQAAYPNQQGGQSGGSGRVQHGAGQYGGVAPYMGR